MPFMIGREPIRRTVKYLESGKLVLKNSIQILSLHYNTHGENHRGMRLEVAALLFILRFMNDYRK